MTRLIQLKYRGRKLSTDRGKSGRLGTAVVETAITLPILTVLVFGAIETANAIFLRQSLAIATYEGAREMSLPGATQTQGSQRVQEVLSSRGITNYLLTVTPTVSAATLRGTQLTVTVETTATSIGIGPLTFFKGKKLTQTTNMVRL